MTDELDKLKLSLKSATPQPSEAAKKAALMLAQESFEKNYQNNFQGSVDEARPMNNRPDKKVGLFKGFSKMFSQLTSKQAYLCLLYTSPSPRDQRGSRMPSSA